MDLGEHGFLIMLLRGHGRYAPGSMAFETFASYPQADSRRTELLKSMETLNAAADIPADHLWTFVVLNSSNNPESMRQVDVDHPEITLGSDVRFLPAHIEMTVDQVTVGIEKSLPWVKQAPSDLGFQVIGRDAPFSYRRRDFELGAK